MKLHEYVLGVWPPTTNWDKLGLLMFAIPGILGLIVFVHLYPQEYFTFLQRLPLLYLFLAAAVFGLVIDLKQRLVRPIAAPQLIWMGLYLVWCIAVTAAKAGHALIPVIMEMGILFSVYFVISHAVQSFRGLHIMSGLLVAIIMFLAFLGIHQKFADKQCIELDPTNYSVEFVGKPDGRPCHDEAVCYDNNPEPGAEYHCERVGLMGTTSVVDRVRYRAKLKDPNELALTMSVGLPLAFALFFSGRSRLRLAVAVVMFLLVVVCVKFTGSRGGLLVFATVIGCYFLKRYKAKAIIATAVLALPMLVVMKASRGDASESSRERLECLYEGMTMWRSSPVLGVGMGQFTEYHFLTAHNSYVLTVAEVGIVGMFLWLGVIYMSVKPLLIGFFRYSKRSDSQIAAYWAMALLASMAGMLVGIFFLSFSYHVVLWVYWGLCGAFYTAVKKHDPDFKVRFGLIDLGLLATLTVGISVGLFVFTRLRPPGS
jgi:hypothetical protein